MVDRAFHEITEGMLLPRLVRLEENLFGAAFMLMKLVPARHILRKGVERGEIGKDTLIAETTSGTFGLALAMQAALLERRLVLVSDPVIDANLYRRLTDLGAHIEICDKPAEVGGYQEARLQRLAQVRAENPDSFCPEQYSNPDNPAAYQIVAEHIERTLGPVDCVVGPVGSGGSMCGTVGTLRSGGREVRAIAVDTHKSVLFGQPDGKRPLRGLGNSLYPSNLDHTLFDEVHWCTAAEAFLGTRQLHRKHALFQGPTSGAAYQVARWYARQNPDAKVVVMLPDEGYRYVDTVYDDPWLRENGFALDGLPAGPIELGHPAEDTDSWSSYPWARRKLSDVTRELEPVS